MLQITVPDTVPFRCSSSAFSASVYGYGNRAASRRNLRDLRFLRKGSRKQLRYVIKLELLYCKVALVVAAILAYVANRA